MKTGQSCGLAIPDPFESDGKWSTNDSLHYWPIRVSERRYAMVGDVISAGPAAMVVIDPIFSRRWAPPRCSPIRVPAVPIPRLAPVLARARLGGSVGS